MASKNIKVEKKSKKKFSFNKVLFYLKSLINNGVCKEVGMKHWIISIFVFLLSVFISAMPVLTTEATRQGSSSVRNSSNDILVEALQEFAEDTESNDLKIEDHKMSLTETSSSSLVYTFQRDNVTSTTNYRLDIYFFDTTEGHSSFESQAASVQDNNPSLQSVIFFSTDYYQLTIVNPSTSSTVATSGGGFAHIEDISSFKAYLSEGITSSMTLVEKREAYLDNFGDFLDLGYLQLRGQTVGIYTGITLGVNGGITLVVTLIFFLLTRGKANPNRQLKYYHTMGITFMSTLTPAILALIIGYIFGGSFAYVAVIYVMLFGFRSMYMSMKYLRPAQY